MSTKKKAPQRKVVKKAPVKAAKVAKAAKSIKKFADDVTKAVQKAVKTQQKKNAPKTPSLESIIADAEKAFGGIVKNYWMLGQQYVLAVRLYGVEGKRAFRARFPLTENALRNLHLVGEGKLLPQFALCSNKFTFGLAAMRDSIAWQQKLLGISENGEVRVKDRDGVIRSVRFEDFVKNKEIDTLLSFLGNEGDSLNDLERKVLGLRGTVRSRFPKSGKPKYQITSHGTVMVVHFNRGFYTSKDLRAIADELDAAK